RQDKGKTPKAATSSQGVEAEEAKRISQIHFGLDKMEAYYVSFKGKWSITAEAQFEGMAGPLKAQKPNRHDSLLIIRVTKRKEINIIHEDINSIYWADIMHSGLAFTGKLEDKDNQFAWLASSIAEGRP
ncbi:hypothetical protein HAX54_007153, partial [Datura stramonium]|nr:hypothetical protein [Datura stramonium]